MNIFQTTTNNTQFDPLFTPEETSGYLKIHLITLAKWRSTGSVDLPFIKIGRAVRYRKSDLNAFFEKNQHAAHKREEV